MVKPLKDVGMINCWEFMGCPRETRTKCPAYPAKGLDCWKMLSTMCDGGKHEMSSMAEKVAFCRNCEFYLKHAKRHEPRPASCKNPESSINDIPD